MIRRTDRSKKERSKRSEKRAAALFSGRRQPASGALPVAALKADVKSEDFLIEDKTTDRTSFAVNFKKLRELKRQAMVVRRKPLFRIESAVGTYYVLDELTFLSMLDQSNNNKER